ncbi:MAG: type II toxin-antitoxin system HicA family toxin [Candidatus Uhrbacteria bacterium]
MSQFEKLLEKISNTKTSVRFVELEKILLSAGYKRQRQKGSHVHFRKPGSPSLTIPVHNNKVKKVYVREVINLLEI